MLDDLHPIEDTDVLPAAAPLMVFDLSSLAYLQTSELTVRHPITDEPTTWKISFAGPGHPVTVALTDEIARRTIEQRQTREEAMTNGRKWKAPSETPAKNRKENALNMAKRILDWTPVVLKAGAPALEYSSEAAMAILANPDFGWLYEQVRRFLNDDAGFIKNSELN